MTEAAFQNLYGQYRDPLFRFGYRVTGSSEVAEDLVHDCFVGLFRGGFDDRKGSLKTYLYGAMRNLCRKHYRDAGRLDELDEAAVGTGLDPLEGVISHQTAGAVRRAVESLPLPQREVLVLFEYEELALDEIARIVDADVGAVKSRLYRAREALRKTLGGLKEATL